LPVRVFAGSWRAFIFAIRDLVTAGVHIFFSATTQTGNRLVNIVWAVVAAIENPIDIVVLLAADYATTTHTGHILSAV
jgi:hypothetical protein